ncbi:Lsr2 family protein [Dactylosporangium sp. NBC_01737]|uniref:histone-like nucleoid-structuring protein Lsr2 n=1 Tax=Dactylosporangium sp. NBC_01737 TaxID=2975959 RepID=UPI002E124A30|nr:Lsr2 family protein [Dactylosporangium sp. NBC_01737]
MAKLIRHIVTDDLDNSTDGVANYTFALEDVTYEIDLTPGNIDRLRAALAPFTAAGRRLPKRHAASRAVAAAAASSTGDATAVRAWWAENWQHLNLPAHRNRGAIPIRVRRAYAADRHAQPRPGMQ